MRCMCGVSVEYCGEIAAGKTGLPGSPGSAAGGGAAGGAVTVFVGLGAAGAAGGAAAGITGGGAAGAATGAVAVSSAFASAAHWL